MGYEDRRVEGLWFADPRNGDVHVGRNQARADTGTMDRNAKWRDAFVLAEEWQEAGPRFPKTWNYIFCWSKNNQA